jgi:hypothetical protein
MPTNIQKNTKIYKFLFPLLLLTLTWTYIFISSGIFKAGFNYFLDDHQIILSHSNYISFDDIIVRPFTSLFTSDQKSRFRPLYDVFIRLFSQIYGLNPFLWYLSSFLVAITTTGIFYVFAKLQNFSYLESTIFAALIVFGQQASTYARFGTPETTSTFFLALAFLFGSFKFKKNIIQLLSDSLFLLFALLASLNKEACILMLPALAFFKVWAFSRKSNISLKDSLSRNKNATLLILSAFILFITYIKLANITGPGYAGIDRGTFSIHNFRNLLRNFKLAIFINIIYAIIYFKNNRLNGFHISRISGFYILSCLIIIPQLILYSKSGINMHYFLPVAIGNSLLIIYPIKKIREKSNLHFQILMFALILTIFLVISQNIIITKKYFQDVLSGTNNIQEMVTDISKCINQNSSLVIFGNPYTNYELLFAFKTVMDEVIKNNNVFLATYGSQKSNFITNTMKKDENGWQFLDPGDIEKRYNYQTIKSLNQKDLDKVKVIIVANASIIEKDLVKFKFKPSWFESDIFTRKYYPHLNLDIYCRK